MNVLLTGGTGYIGSHTAAALAEIGHEAVLFDNLSNSSETVLEGLSRLAGRDFPFVRGDVRDTELLRATLESYRIEAVIHFAGFKAVGESVQRPIDYYANNVQASISLLQAMHAQKIKSLIFSSSATVYGEPKYLPLDEGHSMGPTNPYGRSKLHIEEMLRDLAASDPRWSIVCLRYFNPVGAHESGLIGESPNGVPDNLMPFIAQVASGVRSELTIFGDDYPTPDGTGVRDYIHVMDLAEGHAAGLDFLKKSPGWHAVNLGTGKGYSVLEIVRKFEAAAGRQVPYRLSGRRPGDVAACYADPSKAMELFGWQAKRTLKQMCESTWRFQQCLRANGDS